MTNIKTLLKVWLLEFFGINKLLHQKNKTKTIFFLIGAGFLALFFLGLSTSYSIGLAILLKPINQLILLPVIMMTLTSLITLFSTIYKANSVLFAFEDFDLVMSLPIKASTILASRVWLLYVVNLVFSTIIMLPCGIVYAVFSAPPLAFYCIYLITFFFIPLVPMILATFLGGIVSFITARFKHANKIATVFYLGLFIAIFLFSMTTKTSSEIDFTTLGNQITKTIYTIYPVALLYANSLQNNSLLSVLFFVFLSCGCFFLFIALFARVFQPIHTRLTTSKANANYTLKKIKQTTPFKALYKKELQRYLASTLYVVNTSFGLFLSIIACLAIFFLGIEKITQVANIPDLPLYLAQYTPFVISLFISLSCTTACAISMEGKNLWILKSTPISIRTIFWSKIAINLTITVPIAIVCPTLLSLVIPFHWFQLLMTYLIPLTYCFLIAFLGLILNLQFPIFNWTSEVAVVKQSTSVFLSMLAGFAIIAIPIGILTLLNPIGNRLALGIVAIVLLLITIACYRYLMVKGKKQFLNL